MLMPLAKAALNEEDGSHSHRWVGLLLVINLHVPSLLNLLKDFHLHSFTTSFLTEDTPSFSYSPFSWSIITLLTST